IWSLVVLICIGVVVYFLTLILIRDNLIKEMISKGLEILGRFKKSPATEEITSIAQDDNQEQEDVVSEENESNN
ncbi:MAG: hypothetical protein K2J13_00790, partial [Clostridia bacterium]|nr:hypothetical protein [Clostridia bacterium]